MSRLDVENLSVAVGAGNLAGPVSFSVGPGHPLTILGETGAGKSLIAQAILGALPRGLTATGRVLLDGRELSDLPRRKREALWGSRIALLPQEPWRALDPTMTAFEQVREGYRLVAGLSADDALTAACSAFARLGLEGAEDKLPGALSGGMAQRVAFAAALAGGADLLLADEPTKGLDAVAKDSVIALLREALQSGRTLITITHDVAVARALGGDAMILRNGRVVEEGPVADILARPQSDYGRELVAADPAMWPRAGTPAAAAPVPLMQARALNGGRGGRTLFAGLDLTLRAGERLAVTGPSGIGKSTLLDILGGLLSAAGGQVMWQPGLRPFAVQKLYQDPPAAFPARVRLRQTLNDLCRRHDLPWSRMEQMLADLSVPLALLDRRPDAVSGGELQRIALARVLALRPAAILADEPTSRLDPVTQKRVMEVIAAAAEDTGAAVVLVTHDPEIAHRWAHRSIALAPMAAAAAGSRRAA